MKHGADARPLGYNRADERRRQEPVREARQAPGPARARVAGERGAVMRLATAAEYALMLTAPGPPPSGPPAGEKLSARERELVTLVAQGRTDAQIAARLYISVRRPARPRAPPPDARRGQPAAAAAPQGHQAIRNATAAGTIICRVATAIAGACIGALPALRAVWR